MRTHIKTSCTPQRQMLHQDPVLVWLKSKPRLSWYIWGFVLINFDIGSLGVGDSGHMGFGQIRARNFFSNTGKHVCATKWYHRNWFGQCSSSKRGDDWIWTYLVFQMANEMTLFVMGVCSRLFSLAWRYIVYHCDCKTAKKTQNVPQDD